MEVTLGTLVTIAYSLRHIKNNITGFCVSSLHYFTYEFSSDCCCCRSALTHHVSAKLAFISTFQTVIITLVEFWFSLSLQEENMFCIFNYPQCFLSTATPPKHVFEAAHLGWWRQREIRELALNSLLDKKKTNIKRFEGFDICSLFFYPVYSVLTAFKGQISKYVQIWSILLANKPFFLHHPQ